MKNKQLVTYDRHTKRYEFMIGADSFSLDASEFSSPVAALRIVEWLGALPCITLQHITQLLSLTREHDLFPVWLEVKP